MVYTEFRTVEKPIIEWLQKIGWRYVNPEDLKRDSEEPFDLPTLRESLKSLNPAVIQADEDVEKVINQLRRPLNDITGNRKFLEWIKGERSLVLRAGQKAKTISLIDFGSPENNSLVVTSQFKFAGHENVRFDIVLMVNGIPLAVIEAKLPTKAGVDYHNAIEQIQRYDKQAPQLLKYLAFTCVTDGITFRYDWVTRDKFFEWKNEQFPDPVKSAVFSLFGKRTFLDIISNFIVFEKNANKYARRLRCISR